MSWKKVKIGDLCIIEKGAIGILKAIPGEYPMVVTSEERKSHNEYQFDDEAVIIPLVSSTGHGHKSLKRIHFQKGKFAVGSILCAVIPKNKAQLSAEYLYRFLDLNKENELVARMKGMANVTLPMKEIAQIEIPLPPLNEQNAFVEKHKNLETQSTYLDTELTHQLDLVKKLRQQFLQEVVQGKLIRNEELEMRNTEGVGETGAALLERIKAEKVKTGKKEKPLLPIKEDEIPFDIPDNWVWCRLGEIVNHIFDGPFGSHLKSSDYTESGVQVLRLENLGEMKFKHEKQTFVSHKKYETISQHRVYEGDIIIGSFLADGVKCVILPKLENIAIAKADCFCIRINHPLFLKEYAQFLLSSKPMFLELSSLLRGMTRLRINTTQLKSLPVPLPPLSIQAQIVSKVEELMGLCDALEVGIRASKGVNEALLQQVLREALAG